MKLTDGHLEVALGGRRKEWDEGESQGESWSLENLYKNKNKPFILTSRHFTLLVHFNSALLILVENIMLKFNPAELRGYTTALPKK